MRVFEVDSNQSGRTWHLVIAVKASFGLDSADSGEERGRRLSQMLQNPASMAAWQACSAKLK